MWRYVPRTMLFAASESAVTKKPRLRLTRRRSSSVRPRGSFQSSISRLMLISCGIQWLAHAARYFSHAHLYLNGTSWLRSALELITRLSSTVMRRKASPAGASSSFFPAPVGTKPVVGWIAKPGMGGVSGIEGVKPASSSKLSMRLSSGGRRGQREKLLIGRSALAFARVVHLAGSDVEVPLAAGERHPVAVLRVLPEEPRGAEVGGVAEMHRMEHEQPPARNHHRVQSRRPGRGPQPRDERAGELARAKGDHVLAPRFIDRPRNPDFRSSRPWAPPWPEPRSAAPSWSWTFRRGSRPSRAGSKSSSGRGSRRACRCRRAACPRRRPYRY